MLTDRELQETIARCVSIVVYYQVEVWTSEHADQRTSEIRSAALELGKKGYSAIEAQTRVVIPVRQELIARFGPSEGPRIAQIFADAFQGDDEEPLGWTDPRRRSASLHPPTLEIPRLLA